MLIDPLFAHAAQQPDELAVVDDRGRYTYQQLAGMAAGLAAVVAARTTRPRVGLLLPNGGGFVAGFYGILAAGKTVVPINFLLGEKEIAHVIRDSAIDTILSAPPLADRLKGLPLNVIDISQLPAPDASPSSESAPHSATPPPRHPATPPLAHSADPNDLAVLMYTSGTSGLPKGVPLTYGNIQSGVDGAIMAASFQHRHRFYGILPLFHVFGMVANMLAPIQLGASVLYAARFSPVGMLKAIREHSITIASGVPSMFGALLRLKDASPADFAGVHLMLCGGEPLPATLREAFPARYGIPLHEAYGMTEASLGVSLNTPQHQKPGSVGRPIPGMEVKVVDDAGNAVPAGEEGEFWLRGPMMVKAYHNLPTETAAAFTPDGYFKTGDLGRIDADGFLFITGRKKDLIIVAGENVAPREVEEMLMSHPAVAEAAVVGRRDESRGEVVVAFVIAREGQPPPDPEDLREFCRKQGLAQWKVPREVKVVADLPRSPTGKVMKRALLAADAGV